MYNDYYPDLILEGLLYDLEYVSESSNNKEGILTKLKIAIKKLVQKIISLFRKIKEKIFGKKKNSENNKSSNQIEEIIEKEHPSAFLSSTKFDAMSDFVSYGCKKDIDDMLNKFENTVTEITKVRNNHNIRSTKEMENEMKKITDNFEEYMKNYVDIREKLSLSNKIIIVEINIDMYNDAYKNLEIMKDNEIDIYCNELYNKLENLYNNKLGDIWGEEYQNFLVKHYYGLCTNSFSRTLIEYMHSLVDIIDNYCSIIEEVGVDKPPVGRYKKVKHI